MSEFDGLRDKLTAGRRQLESQRQEALMAREALKQAERALESFSRRADPQSEAARQERLRLEIGLKRAQERTKAAAGLLTELRQAESGLWEQFGRFTDPRGELARWSDRHPILLFPLRLETRFKTGPAGQPQLWVRVFPDACLLDSFEESLTEGEVENARQFWASIWRAGGDEAHERSAWRDLVAAHGSGRAGWIVRRFFPVAPGEKPRKDRPGDMLLIIPAEENPPQVVLDRAPAYWEAYWKAVGPSGAIDMAARQAAYAALEADVGADRARLIAEQYRPFNLNDAPEPPSPRDQVRVEVKLLRLPSPENMDIRRSSWSSAPRVELLPERFVLVGYWNGGEPLVAIGNPIHAPLIAGPDPNAPEDEMLKPVGDALQIPDDMAWMFDFERAVQVGMAMRIDLNPQQAAAGFDRVVVLGLRLSDSPAQGRNNLSRLLEHHLHSRAGLELLPQGAPTNNTEAGGAGYSFRDNPDASFGPFFRQEPQYTLEPDPLLRRDGQWLASALGLDDDLVQRIPNSGGSDQLEARAMQIALWPGTLGYALSTLLAPAFSAQTVAAVRWFFTRYVSGRGPLPALRIGGQPYGILPTAAFERLRWFGDDQDFDDWLITTWRSSFRRAVQPSFLARLYAFLLRVYSDWKPLLERVSFIGKPGGDPHQTLLDVLGLHPGSVEYYPLQAESLDHRFNELAFLDYGLAQELAKRFPINLSLDLLRSFGYEGKRTPDLLNMIYTARQTPLTGPVVDDRPLSESDAIRPYAGNLNYIQWLIEAAQTGIERVQQEQGFDGGRKPAALLYLLLRHAIQRSFQAAGVRLQFEAGLIPEVEAALREPPFVHVQDVQIDRAAVGRAISESSYAALFSPAEAITGRADRRLGDHIALAIRTIDPDLSEQLTALERLSLTPTARLERLFAEHIDTVSYRLDAWKTGLLAWQLERMRLREKRPTPAGGEPGGLVPGLYLGAYGWLEPLRPEPRMLTPADLDQDLAAEINRPPTVRPKRDGDGKPLPPLMRDSANQGLVHAPSLNHAITAAVLRNGYLANDGRLAVDLSSRRVNQALATLEGMRGGQSLGALLGYQFERHVHDHGPLRVHALIYPLRREFPLVANQISGTNTETGQAKESIAAMNVVDGRKLIERVESTGVFTYPFGVDALPPADAGQATALTNALAHIRNINDAVADLILAEGVHQAVLGNYDRSAGTLDAFAKGNYPPEPEVVRTPRSGVALTLRAAIHLSPGPHPAGLTPLAKAEPALNAWLRDRLPTPGLTGCSVAFTDAAGKIQAPFISQANLGLDAIDLVYRLEAGESQALTDLDDRILHYLHAHFAPRLDRPIEIRYTERLSGQVNWFELGALLRSLRALSVASRPLTPADLMRHNDAQRDEQAAVSLEASRIEVARDDLRDTHIPALGALAANLANLAIPIDAALTQFAATVGNLAAYRLPGTGTGFAYEWRAETYSAMTKKVEARVVRWNARRDDCLRRIQAYDNLPPATPEAERIAMLQAAEVLIAARLTLPVPPSATYRGDLNIRRDDFIAKRDDLQDLVDAARPTLAKLLDDANAVLPLDDFDLDPFDFADTQAEIDRFRRGLAENVRLLKEDVEKRLARVNALLTQATGVGGAAAVRLLQEASKVLFGDDYVMVPQITLPLAAADEIANAWTHFTSGGLTAYLTGDPAADPPGLGRDFPVDDWLHGVARVRDKMRHWENAILLGEALPGAQPPELTPLQMPYKANDPWLALEYPPGHVIDSDRLLYTAHFAAPFDKTKPVSGLLVDEWTEVIPGTDEATGVTFHFDRPNAEPPQAWLLVMPAAVDGAWSWGELLAAVNDALDSARMRLIEPVHIDDTAYSAFLPATVSSYTFPEISISNNWLRNLDIYTKMKGVE